MPDKDVLTTLRAQVKGLTFPSESDKPVKVVGWNTKGEGVDEAALRAAASLPPEARVETVPLADFFAPVTTNEDWFGAEERARAAQFRELQTELEKSLTALAAFRVLGAHPDASRVDAYVVGRTSDGALAGIQTQLIET